MAIMKKPTPRTPTADARAEAFIAGAPDAGGRRGGGRVPVNFTVPRDVLAEFDAACARRGITRSAGLALAMTQAAASGF